MVIDSIYWFGVQGYEGRMADVWVNLCSTAHSVVEIGANVGLFTVLGGRAARGRYLAVEPIPEIAAVLRRNLARNNLTASIDVRQAAAIAGSVETPIEISIPDEGRGAPVGAHVTMGSEVADRGSARVISVPGLPFSSLVAQADLIKLDAEGLEVELLGAAAEPIARNRPTIVTEVLPESDRLAALIGTIATARDYTINVIPAYGSDVIVTVPAEQFRAETRGGSIPRMSSSRTGRWCKSAGGQVWKGDGVSPATLYSCAPSR